MLDSSGLNTNVRKTSLKMLMGKCRERLWPAFIDIAAAEKDALTSSVVHFLSHTFFLQFPEGVLDHWMGSYQTRPLISFELGLPKYLIFNFGINFGIELIARFIKCASKSLVL